MAKKTYVVVHPKLHLHVPEAKKLQHVPAGSRISLDDKVAEKLGAKIRPYEEGDLVAVGESKGKPGPKPKDPETPPAE